MYGILKDFAGPFATIVAASVAAYVTWCFASYQINIANQQAATALDQLRYNLFEKRYNIYKEMNRMVRDLLNESHKKEFNDFDNLRYLNPIWESKFFFPDHIYRWLDKLWNDDVVPFLSLRHDRSRPEFSEKERTLITRLREIQDLLGKELEFPQLTRPTSVQSRNNMRLFIRQ